MHKWLSHILVCSFSFRRSRIPLGFEFCFRFRLRVFLFLKVFLLRLVLHSLVLLPLRGFRSFPPA